MKWLVTSKTIVLFLAFTATFVLTLPVYLIHHRLSQAAATSNQEIDALRQADIFRARLDDVMNNAVALSRGYEGLVNTEPEITLAIFNAFSRAIFPQDNPIWHTGLAPDLILQFIYPPEGNSPALGLNYMEVPGQRETVLRAVESGQFLLAGPLELVQGGKAFILRYPLMIHSENEDEHLYGVSSIPIGFEDLFDYCGIENLEEQYLTALYGRDGLGMEGGVVREPEGQRKLEEPLTLYFAVPGGRWVMLLEPRTGWGMSAEAEMVFNGLYAASALALFTFLSFMGMQYRQVRSANEELRNRNREIETLNESLLTFDYSVSNVLQVPARHIAGLVQILKDENSSEPPDTENSTRLMEQLKKSAEKLSVLLRDLHMVSSLFQRGLKRSELSVERLVNRAAIESLPGSDRLRIRFSASENTVLYGDENLMTLCISRLFDFINEVNSEGRADVEFRPGADAGSIEICFTQDPLSRRDVTELFKPFYNYHQRDTFIGPELGLFISRRIIEFHGGTVTAQLLDDDRVVIELSLS